MTEYDETMDKLASLFDHDNPESEPTLVQCRVLAPAASDLADIGIKLSAARDHESKTVWLRSDADGMRESGSHSSRPPTWWSPTTANSRQRGTPWMSSVVRCLLPILRVPY